MRHALFAAVLLLPAAALAQQTAPAAAPPPGATSGATPGAAATQPKAARQTFREHFDSANTTHDGHLTLDQAKTARWTAVVRRFDKMDADHKGYVTPQDIYAEFARERAEKAKTTATPASAVAGSKS
jgi:hypothetical protein